MSEKPNFSVLIYGVTILSELNQKWLEESLYHRKLLDEELEMNNILSRVSKNTPPAFLVHSIDDDVCNVNESIYYANKLIENNVFVELHLFSKGGHGFGVGRVEDGTDQWIPLLVNWLKNDFNADY